MPAVSEAQRRLFGMALAVKRGQAKPKKGSAAARIAKTVGEAGIVDFATKRKGKK